MTNTQAETIKGLDIQIAQLQILLETLKKEKEQEIANAQAKLKHLKKQEKRTIKQLEFYRRFEHEEDMDGIEYALGSSWEEIDDPIFHKKCKDYRNAATGLKEYVWSKIKELESMNDSNPS